jgi:hypothetical protein
MYVQLFSSSFSWFLESPHHLLNPLPPNPRFQELSGALIVSSVAEEDKGNYRLLLSRVSMPGLPDGIGICIPKNPN